MADSKISALTSGTTPTYVVGEESATNTYKYSGDGVYNVKTYGATGDGVTNDTTFIQNAVNAALAGGYGSIVFFPPGNYVVSKAAQVGAITFDGTSTAGIRVIGAGSRSVIKCSSTQYVFDVDYILATSEIKCPVASFEYLSIVNTAAITALTSSETCAGGIHISGGGSGGILDPGCVASPRIHHCNFVISGGIAIFSAAQNMAIESCWVTGSYTGNNALRSVGIFVNGASVRDCKLTGLGYPIISCGSGGGVIDAYNIDIEVSGTVSIGYSPFAFLTTITI